MNIPFITKREKNNLTIFGIIKKGSFVRQKDIIIGKIKTINSKSATTRLFTVLFGGKIIKNTSLYISKNICGDIFNIKINKNKNISIIVYLREKRKIQIGDKISGRHGNKGIIAKIIPLHNMPYLPDGTILDIILNPLGIPSRMNLGQVFECLLGLSGKYLKENYELSSFEEINSQKISLKITYNKIYEASNISKKKWIFNPNNIGKIKIFNTKTNNCFTNSITIGYSYIIKLIHLVKDKIAVRNIGSYSILTKQPLKGKAKKGGQRFGEMEVWALEGFGAAYILQELLTFKSDDLSNKYRNLTSLIKGNHKYNPSITETLKVFFIELQGLCLNIKYYKPFI